MRGNDGRGGVCSQWKYSAASIMNEGGKPQDRKVMEVLQGQCGGENNSSKVELGQRRIDLRQEWKIQTLITSSSFRIQLDTVYMTSMSTNEQKKLSKCVLV